MKIKTQISVSAPLNGNVCVSVTVTCDGIEVGSVPVFSGPAKYAASLSEETLSLPAVLYRYMQDTACALPSPAAREAALPECETA